MKKRRLIQNSDFERFKNFARPIIVYFGDGTEEGVIQFYNESIVKINESYFVRNVCEFWAGHSRL